VNVLVRALQDANRLQILSRPQVMTLDTIEAYVLVGQRVPRVNGVSGGSTVSPPVISTSDTEVGLIMRIQPRTNQDGLILLDVQIERSSLGPESTGIPVGFSANGDVIRSPIINTTRAQTRISAYDGQTVVFAGLIQKTRSSRSRRIPWLADIPVAGHLFKFESEQESRSELLVILTPRIIHGETDLEMVNQLETARMSWCLSDVVNINGVQNLSSGNGFWGPPCSAVIYPDVNPCIEYVDGVQVNGLELNEAGVPVGPIEVVPTEDPAVTPVDPIQPAVDPALVPQAYLQQGQPNVQMPSVIQPANYQNPTNVYIQR
jgi:Flp pilus assembly secretin CpaC